MRILSPENFIELAQNKILSKPIFIIYKEHTCPISIKQQINLSKDILS